jgi:hypothetical protein
MGILSAVVQGLIILDCVYPVLVLDPDAVGSVMSTCSEVIAGLYGITLTGYIFFADRFRDIPQDDESLYDAVQSLLLRYNHMAGFISILCLVCIVFGEGIVLYGTNTLLPPWLYRFLVSETLLFFFWSFNFILYFVISVLDPQKISRISTQQMESISDDKNLGDVDAFMADWSEIEETLYVLRENLARGVRFIPGGRAGNKPQLVQTLETLRNYGRINHNLWRKLEKLRQYRNHALHDLNSTVSQEMCNLAKEVMTELENRK